MIHERKKNAAEIRRRFLEKRKLLESPASILRFLMSKGIAKAIAEDICLLLSKNLGTPNEQVRTLSEILASKIKTTGEFHFQEPFSKVIALVGPRGVGKTTTVLKLASRYGVHQHKRVGLVSLDEEKGGALQQLEKWATQWKIPLYSGWEGVSKLSRQQLILIDTTGCNFYQAEQVDKLGEKLLGIDNVEVHLVLSAAMKDVDLYGAIHQFSSLPLKSLIFTKLDETLAAGVLLNISSKVDIPISYIAYGYPLPGEIQTADSKEIVKRILAEGNEKEFQFLRHLVIKEN